MNFCRLFLRDLRHYVWHFAALSASAGLVCAILTSALLIGSSVRGTLQDNLEQNTSFVKTLLRFPVPIQTALPDGLLHTAGVVADSSKAELYAFPDDQSIKGREAYCSPALTEILGLQPGDLLTVRVQSIADINSESLAGRPPQLKQLQFIYCGEWPDPRAGVNFTNPQLCACNLFVNHSFLAHALGVPEGSINQVWSQAEASRVQLPDATLWELSQLYFDSWEGRPVLKSRAFFLPEGIQTACPQADPGLSLFVESFSAGDSSKEYFFAAAFAGDIFPVPENHAVIGGSAAIAPGSSGVLTSFRLEGLRTVKRQTHRFPQVSSADDCKISAALTPEIPGLTDARDCSRWDAGLPIDLSKITPARRQYWETYRSKPELYLNYEQAQQLLAPGKCTTLIFPQGADTEIIRAGILDWLRQEGQLFQSQAVSDILQQNIAEGVHFAPLFLGLSLVIIIAALLVLAMLLKLHLLSRSQEFALLGKFTACPATLRRFHLGELFAVILPGLGAGLLLGTIICHLQLRLLEGLWNEIITMQSLNFHARLSDFLLALAASCGATALVLVSSLRRPAAVPRYYLNSSRLCRSAAALGLLSFLRRFGEYRYCLILLLLGFLGTLGVGAFGIRLRGEDAFSHRYVAETVLPVVPAHDRPLPEGVLPVRVYQADDSDCSNLLLARTPTAYGCDIARLTGEQNFLPPFAAAVDSGSLKWIIKKKVGDRIAYPQGEVSVHRTMQASVFQAGILLDEKTFSAIFPNHQGANFFLIPDQQTAAVCREYLADYGVTLQTAAEFMARAENVQNRYLAIFLQLGLLGFILGLGSLLLLLLRNLLTRKDEIIFLQETGCSQSTLFWLFCSENLSLYLSSALSSLLLLLLVALFARLHLPTLVLTWVLLCALGCTLIAFCHWCFFRCHRLPQIASGQ